MTYDNPVFLDIFPLDPESEWPSFKRQDLLLSFSTGQIVKQPAGCLYAHFGPAWTGGVGVSDHSARGPAGLPLIVIDWPGQSVVNFSSEGHYQ